MPLTEKQYRKQQEIERIHKINALILRKDIAKIFNNMSKSLDLKPVLLRIPREHYAKLEEIADEYAMPKSVLIRKAVVDYIAKEYPNVYERKKVRLAQT